jgi:phospholipase C
MRTLLLALLSTACAHRIKHVVVLYEENRAFDHLLGHQKVLKVDGLKGDESNPVDRRDPSKGSVAVFDGAPYVAVEQPRHGYAPYQVKLDVQDGVPQMDGFVEFERAVHKGNTSVADAVMQGFSDGALPISTALASEFAVFDRWYTAFPGPSWPNHMFSYSATAAGATNTGDGYLCEKDRPYPQRTIFDSLIDAGYEYMRIYKYVVPRSNFNFDVTPSPRRRRRKTASKRCIGAMSHVASTPSTHRRGAAPSTRIHVARPSQRLHNRHLHGGVWIEGNAPPDAHHGPLLRRRGAWHAAGAHLDRPAPGREHVARCVEINQ